MSSYTSYQAFSSAAFQTYQQAVDEGFALGQQALGEGTLRVPSGVPQNTVLGQFMDQYSRGAMQDWLESEGIDASNSDLININQRLINPDFSGGYRTPAATSNSPTRGQVKIPH